MGSARRGSGPTRVQRERGRTPEGIDPAEPSATEDEPAAPEAGTGLAGMGLPIWLAVVPLRALVEPQAPRMAEREVSVPHAMAWAIHWRRLKLSTASIISTEQEIFIERIVVACK